MMTNIEDNMSPAEVKNFRLLQRACGKDYVVMPTTTLAAVVAEIENEEQLEVVRLFFQVVMSRLGIVFDPNLIGLTQAVVRRRKRLESYVQPMGEVSHGG